MSPYSLRAIQPSDYGHHEILIIIRGFSDAGSAARQQAIDHLTTLHRIDLRTTKTLVYDPTLLKVEGTNHKGDIRIGPGAFKQDYHWLANVIFHEVIHSDQFAFYAARGVQFSSRAVTSETERIMVALDECEGFYWPWRNSAALCLTKDQQDMLQREVRLWLIEVDDAETVALSRKGKFEQARLGLIQRHAAEQGPKP